MEMPPLSLLVLDGLADDLESVETLRNHGDVAPHGLALVDEQDVVESVRRLLEDGLIAAYDSDESAGGLVPVAQPSTDDPSLRRYWFKWTPAGERVWRKGADVLDAYWEAHPIQ
jgi:hypothetical protein